MKRPRTAVRIVERMLADDDVEVDENWGVENEGHEHAKRKVGEL